MSWAHREIIHLARLLRRLVDGLSFGEIDRYLIRDSQRIIEAIEALCAFTMRRKRTSTNTRQVISGALSGRVNYCARQQQLKSALTVWGLGSGDPLVRIGYWTIVIAFAAVGGQRLRRAQAMEIRR